MLTIENPEVTLHEDGHGFPEGAEEIGGIEWSINSYVDGDDGKQYWIDCGILGYPRLNVLGGVTIGADITMLAVRSEIGEVVHSRKSVYKIAKFPNIEPVLMGLHPNGTLKIERSEHEVAIKVENTIMLCKDDKTWHYSMEDKEKGIKAEFVHTGVGFPMWYHDKKKLEAYTPHSVGGGYYWAGLVEGTLTMEGREIKIKGKGARQRYYASDYSSEEVAAWHDWPWFHFDEVFGCLDDMKMTKHKVMGIYLVDEKQYFSDGDFDIEHQDWAYLPQLGAFIPTHFKMTIETEAGVLEVHADTVGTYVWATTEPPDSPFAMLDWDNLKGTFTYKDGRRRTLTNGRGGSMIRQWRPYPSFIPVITD